MLIYLDQFIFFTNKKYRYVQENPKVTLPKTNIAPEMDGWNTTFLLGRPIFMGYVSFREGILFHSKNCKKTGARITFFGWFHRLPGVSHRPVRKHFVLHHMQQPRTRDRCGEGRYL